MRYYRIECLNIATGKPVLGADGSAFGPYSSLRADGSNNPSALNVQFDLPVNCSDVPAESGFLRIWGVGITQIGQASAFNPNGVDATCSINVYGGMSAGLPLANPKQAGLLLTGKIQQAYGNWQGVEQTLDFVIIAGSSASNINLLWQKGQTLSASVSQALTNAFSGSLIVDDTKNSPVLPYEVQTGNYDNIYQLAGAVNQISRDIKGDPNYIGLKIVRTEKGFRLFDGAAGANPNQIEFNDLIGQPTWLGIARLQFKTVMRNDIAVGDTIKMPQTPTITSAASFSQYRNRATFQGAFLVVSVRHMGDLRQPSGDAWVTVIECVVPPSATPTSTPIPTPGAIEEVQ